jgi:hypothetical protein
MVMLIVEQQKSKRVKNQHDGRKTTNAAAGFLKGQREKVEKRNCNVFA